jgi:hypothetical protein
MSLGTRRVDSAAPGDLATALYRDGARRVAIDCPVDSTGGTDARTAVSQLLLLNELTSWGIVVDWSIVVDGTSDAWRLISHLYPPSEVLGHSDGALVRAEWREGFYVCKCVWRQGPGFVEVRDRRAGSLSRFVIDDPDYQAVIARLVPGCGVDEVPAAVLDDLVGEALAGRVGERAWWIPYRLRRWPSPALTV